MREQGGDSSHCAVERLPVLASLRESSFTCSCCSSLHCFPGFSRLLMAREEKLFVRPKEVQKRGQNQSQQFPPAQASAGRSLFRRCTHRRSKERTEVSLWRLSQHQRLSLRNSVVWVSSPPSPSLASREATSRREEQRSSRAARH
jgi:hypothetical protein